MTNLYTGKGDNGTTKLFDCPPGVRVSKTSPRPETLGALDELNAITGWCKVACAQSPVDHGWSFAEILHDVQDHLFTLQAEVAGAPKSISEESVRAIEAIINAIGASLPEIKSFLVPGGTELAARLDIARTTARRTERRLVGLHESGEMTVSASSRAYMNRLSSLFYALERLENLKAEIAERPPQYRA